MKSTVLKSTLPPSRFPCRRVKALKVFILKQKPGGAQPHLGVTCEEGCQRALGSVLREHRVQSRARKTECTQRSVLCEHRVPSRARKTEFTQGSVLCEHRVPSRARKTECTLTGPGFQKRKSFLLPRPAFPPCKRV